MTIPLRKSMELDHDTPETAFFLKEHILLYSKKSCSICFKDITPMSIRNNQRLVVPKNTETCDPILLA